MVFDFVVVMTHIVIIECYIGLFVVVHVIELEEDMFIQLMGQIIELHEVSVEAPALQSYRRHMAPTFNIVE